MAKAYDEYRDMAQSVIIKRLYAEKVTCETTQGIPLFVLDNIAEPGVRIDAVTKTLFISLQLLMSALPDKSIDIEEQYPATWWDAVKERWAPRWLRRMYPVRYKHISIHQKIYKAVCPHVLVPHDDKTHIEWLMRMQDE